MSTAQLPPASAVATKRTGNCPLPSISMNTETVLPGSAVPLITGRDDLVTLPVLTTGCGGGVVSAGADPPPPPPPPPPAPPSASPATTSPTVLNVCGGSASGATGSGASADLPAYIRKLPSRWAARGSEAGVIEAAGVVSPRFSSISSQLFCGVQREKKPSNSTRRLSGRPLITRSLPIRRIEIASSIFAPVSSRTR
ncbi:MAG TPA: hypothetical protein PKA20_26845 [Burkholderiaceae bacterium]|nr:hypothetical protein [Burkholderiaceae bacterium]